MAKNRLFLRTLGVHRPGNRVVRGHTHKNKLDQLNMIDVANDFVFGSEYRKTVFGEFEDVDMRRKAVVVKSQGTKTKM